MAASIDIGDGKRLQLARALQTTLDVEALIDLFGAHLQPLVAHRSLRLRHDAAGIDVRTGEAGEQEREFALVVEGENLGRLCIHTDAPLSSAQANAVESLLIDLLHPLRNACMYRDAINASARDPLTGVNNRSSFRKVLDREVDLSRRHGAPLSLIMLDVDRFKSINDEHGHLAGDIA